MNGTDAGTLCNTLLRAESEVDVVRALEDVGLWQDESAWVSLGGLENNWFAVGNQQRSADTALVEKVINALDAMLVRRCWEEGIDPESTDAPKSMTEAAERFFGIREGRLENLTAKQRTDLAERSVHLVAVGDRASPSYLVIDMGEGQTPDCFPSTFCSLGASNKLRVHFVQGKFNSGGTGVLPWCGTRNLQLVISKRAPGIPPAVTEDPSRDAWGFTVMRRQLPADRRKNSMFVYLAPGGMVPRFNAQALNALPGAYPDCYHRGLPFGTIVKLFNYRLKGGLKTLATLDLRYAFESLLQQLCLPFRLSERRPGFRANYYDTTVSGLSVYVRESDDLEQGFPAGGNLEVGGVGTLPYQLVALRGQRSDSSRRRLQGGVYFTVNGQVHATLGTRFIGETVGFGYLSKDLLCSVETSKIDERVREDLFMASRDRTRDCEEYDHIRTALSRELKGHPGLRELEARRRAEHIRERTDESEAADILEQLVHADPALRTILGLGERLSDPYDPGQADAKWEGRRFPTYFRIKNKPQDGLIKSCPANSYCRVEFETDAANDYFTRGEMPGMASIRGATGTITRTWNGVSTGLFRPPANAEPDSSYDVEVRVTDDQQIEPFVCTFTMVVCRPVPKGTGRHGEKRNKTTKLAIPPVHEVHKEGWSEHDFDKYSGLEVVRSGGSVDLHINMDNAYLAAELKRVSESDADLVKYWYKWGLALLAIGALHQSAVDERLDTPEGRAKTDDEGTIDDQVRCISRGLATVVVPVIRQLSDATH